MKRPIVKYYSQSSVIGLEPLFDTLIEDFCGHLEKRFMSDAQPKECDLGEWIGFCMFLAGLISDHDRLTNSSRLLGHQWCRLFQPALWLHG